MYSRPAGVLAGLLAALYPPAIFFDALIQKTVLDTFFMCALLCLLAGLEQLRAVDADLKGHAPSTGPTGATTSNRRPFLIVLMAGIVLGCFALTRENVLLFVPIVAAWLLIRAAQSAARRVAAVTLFVVGLSIVLVPIGLRNKHIGGTFLITTAQFGPNFFIGNNEKATGLYVPLRPGREQPSYERTDATDLAQQAMGRPLSPAEVSRYWSSRAWEWIGSHPAAWLRLMAVKCWYLVSAHEFADAEDFHFYQLKCSLIRRLGSVFHFGVLAPLALAGFLLTWNRRRELWILYGLLLALALGVVLFIVYSRYRFPMIPILSLFAADGLVEAVRTLRRSGPRSLATVVLAAALAAIVVNRPVGENNPDTARNHSNMAFAYLGAGDVSAAIGELEQALRLEPSLPLAHINLADAYWRQGRRSESIQSLYRARELLPGDEEVALALGTTLAKTGEWSQAEPHLRAALPMASKRPELYANFGVLLARLKKWDEAIDFLRRGVREAPNEDSIPANLAWNLATCPIDKHRNGPEAVSLAEKCCRNAEFKDPGTLDILAAAYAECGRFDDAVAAQQRAIRLMSSIPGHEKTAELQARLKLYQARRPYRQPD
jgi:tetratricopeptide (TPR) repeat protein